MTTYKKKHKKRAQGISLNEILISMLIIGIAVTISIMVIFPHTNTSLVSSRLDLICNDIESFFEHQVISNGPIPQSLGPSDIIDHQLKFSTKRSYALNGIHGNLYTLDKKYTLFVPTNWQNINNKDIALITAQYTNQSSKSLIITRNGEITKFGSATSETIYQNNTLNNANQASEKTIIDAPIMKLPPSLQPESSASGNVGLLFFEKTFRENSAWIGQLTHTLNEYSSPNSLRTSLDRLNPLGSINNLSQFNQFFNTKESISKLTQIESPNHAEAILADQNGNLVEYASSHEFYNNLEINGVNISHDPGWLDWVSKNTTNNYRLWMNLDPYYALISYFYQYKPPNIENAKLSYKSPKTNKFYTIDSTLFCNWFSPVKVSTVGLDAKLDNTDHFNFDADGFMNNRSPNIKTAGGLGQNEAWLAIDRGGIGFYRNGVMDGDDIFGDHLGLYRSGYDDLASTFNEALSIDGHGKRYIALHPLSGWDKLWINLTRLFGQNKAPIASMDLKLLTRERVVVDAADHLSRVYVDYQDVNEMAKDKSTWIRQRALVELRNGKTASSADIWFRPQMVFTIQE